MFVKKYSFKIKSSDLDKYLQINRLAEEVYKKYGLLKTRINQTKENSIVKIDLQEYYPSRKDFEKVIQKVNKDKKINQLWKEFKRLVVGEIREPT